MNAEPIIRVDGLVRRFGEFTAVDHVSLRVHAGEIFAFLGANGSGKSTTIRMLIGLLRPTEGSIVVDGIDVMAQTRRVRDHIGYMGQRVSLYQGLSLRENVEFYGGLQNLAGQELDHRWDRLRERFALGDVEREAASDLPAGVRQRAGLALAILHQPRVLFLDEPTAGVDLVGRALFWELIQEQAAQGRTVFVTTHFLEEADYCDRVSFIDAGKIVADATPAELRERTGTDYVVRVTGPPTGLSAVAAALEAALPPRAAKVTVEGAQVRLRMGSLSPERIVALRTAAEARGAHLLGIDPPDMGDVFRVLAREAGETAS